MVPSMRSLKAMARRTVRSSVRMKSQDGTSLRSQAARDHAVSPSPEHAAPYSQVLDWMVDDESESAAVSPASSSAGFSSSGTSNHWTSISSHQTSSMSLPGSV